MPAAGAATETTVAPAVAPPVAAGPATITAITTFDPDGDGAGERRRRRPGHAPTATPTTSWATECYSSQYMGAKRGVGLVVSFDTPTQQALAVDVINAPYQLRFFASDAAVAPTDLDALGTRTRHEGVRFRAGAPSRRRFPPSRSCTCWCCSTRLGQDDTLHRGQPVSRPTRRDHAGRLNPFVTLRCIATLDDAQLVTAAQSGDRGALDQLLRRHYDRVHSVCRRITGSASDADDACQEALIKIVRNLPRFDGRSSFGTWAYRIATNASLDELRKRQRRPSLPRLVDDRARRPTTRIARSIWRRRAGRRSTRSTISSRSTAALDGLSEDFRVVVVLRDVIDLDYQEIAEVLDIPLGTVKSRIARARSPAGRRRCASICCRRSHHDRSDADPTTHGISGRSGEPRRRPGASKPTGMNTTT